MAEKGVEEQVLAMERLPLLGDFIVLKITIIHHHTDFAYPQQEFTLYYFSRICGSRRKS